MRRCLTTTIVLTALCAVCLAVFIGWQSGDGMNYANLIPDSYREQLEMNARMFVNELNEDRKGLREVRVINCVTDSVQPAANAYLMLCFGDSTFEQVVVPMVRRDGQWNMK